MEKYGLPLYCMIASFDADTMQMRDLNIGDFNLVTEKEQEKDQRLIILDTHKAIPTGEH